MDRNIKPSAAYEKYETVATREGGVDRNTLACDRGRKDAKSPPARVAWIETTRSIPPLALWCVATREGGVDRNIEPMPLDRQPPIVATREGGVDRNHQKRFLAGSMIRSPPARVAWIETRSRRSPQPLSHWSPPARVAWIETLKWTINLIGYTVATREGGVDRNRHQQHGVAQVIGSPPARVAWIETCNRDSGSQRRVSRHPRGWRG